MRPATVLALAALATACAGAPRLKWPAEVRAASERGPLIRPPEDWAHADVAEAFHARGWHTLAESWVADESLGRVGHCWSGAVRPIGDAGGDVVASDFHDHGLATVRLGAEVEVGRLTLYADDRSFFACLADPDVARAVSGLARECAAFGEAIAVLEDAIATAPRSAELTMDALRLRLVVRWREPALPADLTIRRLAGLGFEGELAGEMGSLPRMRRLDDDWRVVIDLPATGGQDVVLTATTDVPRRPICGPEPLPPPRRPGTTTD